MKGAWISLILLILFLTNPIMCHAEISGPEAFDGMEWELVHEETIHGGVVQSMCVTPEYIICIENIEDNPNVNDVVSAYYRYDRDEQGKPVKPYSLAKRIQNREWEHGNSLTYNPKTEEIYVGLYTNTIEENRGCIYVMDPETLEYKRTIKVSDDYNILSIEYIEDKDQYVIQTNVDGGYSFKILDSNFQVIDDLITDVDTYPGTNYQDCMISGDYIITFPLTLNMGIGDYLKVFSIENRELVMTVPLDFQFESAFVDEPESLCETAPGELLAVVNIQDPDAGNRIRFYKTVLPYYFYISAESENGRITNVQKKVLRGDDCVIDFVPDDGYEFSELSVDGAVQTTVEDTTSFMLNNIQSDHKVKVVFREIPFPLMKVLVICGIVCVLILGIILAVIIMARRKRRIKEKKRRAELRKKRREREAWREKLLEKELNQLEELEAIIDK